MTSIFSRANRACEAIFGSKIFFRGLIEFSNVCQKGCPYCGLRKENKPLERFTLSKEEIISAAMFAYKQRWGSIILQSGEVTSSDRIEFLIDLIQKIRALTDDKLTITLSVGELDKETYRALFKAGASRYLLRIETSNPSLYSKIHPEDHFFDKRVACLENLKSVGYQVGTGVMIGIPGQTTKDLANDLIFFHKMDVDMIGMGPYIGETGYDKKELLSLSLAMVALARLVLKDVNIAATTALQVLDPMGREKALLCGANVLMPNITPNPYRKLYEIYHNKPCMDEDSAKCALCLDKRLRKIGKNISYDVPGHAPHFLKRR